MIRLFLTGTDTGVGKTRLSALLLRWLARGHSPVLGLKPVSSGDRGDALALLEASGGLPEGTDLAAINPLHYQSALAPLVAARIEHHQLATPELVAHCQGVIERVRPRALLVEGVGGWEVPLADGGHQAEFIRGLELVPLLVVANRLGALNHTLLTVRAMRADGVEPAGILLNHLQPELDLACITNKTLLPELTGLPILAEVLYEDPELVPEPEWEELLAG